MDQSPCRAPGYVVVILGVLATLTAITVQASHRKGPATRFQHLTIEDGLLQNSAIDILQDDTGFIWIATEEGLHRYDGYGFEVFRNEPGNPRSLQDNIINVLFEDSRQDLWVGTYSGGLHRFNRKSQDFDVFRHDPDNENSLSNDYIAAIAETSTNEYWVATFNGVDVLDADTGDVRHVQVIDGDGNRHMNVAPITVHVDRAERVWVGSIDGLLVYDPELDALRAAGNTDEQRELLALHSVIALAEDFDGSMWIGMYGMLVHMASDGEILKVFKGPPEEGNDLPDGQILSMTITASGELWLGTEIGGLLQYDAENGHFNVYQNDPVIPDSLSDNYIYSLMEDQTGLLWIGTGTGGINIFNPATRIFTHYISHPTNPNSLPSKTVWAIEEDFQGNLWVATDAGLARFDSSRVQVKSYKANPDDKKALQTNDTIVLEEDSKQRLWVGTLEGLYRYHRDSDDFTLYEFEVSDEEDINSLANAITFVFEDMNGKIWIGSAFGIFAFEPATGDYVHYEVGAGTDRPDVWNFTLSAAQADEGQIWIGTEGGLVRFDPEQGAFVEYLSEDPASQPRLSGRYIQTLHRDENGMLWIATTRGLDQFNPESGELVNYRVGGDRIVETINGILDDGAGHLWLSTNKGLLKMVKANGEIQDFDVSDGLQSNEFNGGAYHAATDGTFYFGGINGITAFDPQAVKVRRIPPAVNITKLNVAGKTNTSIANLHDVQGLQFRYDENILTFEFAAFDFAAPRKNRFRFKLDGFDEEWRELVGYNYITYTNLDSGEYRFLVQGANSHGIWSTDTASVQFTVHAPPWRSWWAYSLYALLVMISAWLAFHFQNIRIKHKHELEGEQQKRRWAESLQKLTHSLSSSLDAQEVANGLMDNLQRMVRFQYAAMFIEHGVDLNLLGTRGFSDDVQQQLAMMPDSHGKFFERVRHARLPVKLTREEVQSLPFVNDDGTVPFCLAVPTYSRSDEFSMVLIGRDEEDFNDEEIRIIASFSSQATVSLDNARLFAEVQNLATMDPLTRVNNRRYFFELAELEFSRSKRYKREVAVVLLDADKFREINETYGHEIGDRVLKIIASTCRSNLRHFDIIGRYGGEDFIIILPETPLNVAADVADRLRKGVEGITLDTHLGELSVTVSVGVALASGDVHDLPSLINKADMALYEAKRAGRNRVVVADPDG